MCDVKRTCECRGSASYVVHRTWNVKNRILREGVETPSEKEISYSVEFDESSRFNNFLSRDQILSKLLFVNCL
jgi:hypothetical protein